MEILENPILIANIVALTTLIIALVLYRRNHRPTKASFRIEQVTFKDDLVIFYTMRKGAFGKWKVLKINDVRGYHNMQAAEIALEKYLTELGFEMSESKVVKEYGS